MHAKLGDVEVGETLILHRANRGVAVETVTVTRVGYKYLYVKPENGYEMRERFSIHSGREDTHSGYPDVLYTPEQWADESRRQDALNRLRDAGVTFGVRGGGLTHIQLEAIADIVCLES